ncbi:hypothetical protein [Pseudonocardia humida]|uniref:Uncharacterized protein n=1 Tax=Pseudonocardia humida TaxID=2800819 RepID=A0ABT1ADC5_9PSEU|nr:hypothetical protein [Pseudonocardia humida]MCO1660905.1 hypothetical protein [Pseudonocardia humida]
MPEHGGPEDRQPDPITFAQDAGPGAMPGDTTVSAGTAAALLIGLVGLTGSVVALGVAITIVVLAWLPSTGGDADRSGRDRSAPGRPPPHEPRPPFGGPLGWF